VTVELPEPPSANRWWRHVAGRVVTSREARTYKQAVANRLTIARVRPIPAPQPVAVSVVWFRGRRSGDLDKRLGVLLDALQGTAYDNDSQVTRIHAERHDDPGAARVLVTVEAA
jgi:crossover junction endodeoxyribonuclease RusA